MLLSLSDTIGPRYYYLAKQGLVDAFSDASTGSMQLQRVLQPDQRSFLADVAQVRCRVWPGGRVIPWSISCWQHY